MKSLRKRLAVLILAATATIGLAPAANADMGQFIAGGRLVDHAPWAARVFQDIGGGYVALCSGAMIAQRWVLTAAHCLPEKKTPEIAALGTEEGDVWAYVGNAVWREGTKIDATRAIRHDSADIGLVELSEPANTGTLPLSDDPIHAGDQVQLFGFGATKYKDGPQSPQLKVADAEVLNANPDDPFVVSRGLDGGVLPGDSGGPTVRNGEIVAVHSVYYIPIRWRQGDTSTVLPDRLAWIKETTGL